MNLCCRNPILCSHLKDGKPFNSKLTNIILYRKNLNTMFKNTHAFSKWGCCIEIVGIIRKGLKQKTGTCEENSENLNCLQNSNI